MFKRIANRVANRVRSIEGQGMVEYAFIMALVAIVAAASLGPLGSTVATVFGSVAASL